MSTTADQFEVIRRACTPDKIGLVVMLEPRRIGGYAFIVFLEHRHFTPVPEPREDFELFAVNWEQMRLLVCLVPYSARPHAEEIARELGLRIADGVPCVMDNKGAHHFPVQLPNLFTLENIPGHFVYRNNPAEHKTAYDYENEAVERVVAGSMEKLKRWQQEHGVNL